MLEGSIYCFLVAVWCFVGSYDVRDRDTGGTFILTVIGTLFMVRFVFIVMGAIAARSALLGH